MCKNVGRNCQKIIYCDKRQRQLKGGESRGSGSEQQQQEGCKVKSGGAGTGTLELVFYGELEGGVGVLGVSAPLRIEDRLSNGVSAGDSTGSASLRLV